ncbi:unnamed protein product, partial [Nesidiocoris tenuis]
HLGPYSQHFLGIGAARRASSSFAHFIGQVQKKQHSVSIKLACNGDVVSELSENGQPDLGRRPSKEEFPPSYLVVTGLPSYDQAVQFARRASLCRSNRLRGSATSTPILAPISQLPTATNEPTHYLFTDFLANSRRQRIQTFVPRGSFSSGSK